MKGISDPGLACLMVPSRPSPLVLNLVEIWSLGAPVTMDFTHTQPQGLPIWWRGLSPSGGGGPRMQPVSSLLDSTTANAKSARVSQAW